jgi:hyperosmotically inducible protein
MTNFVAAGFSGFGPNGKVLRKPLRQSRETTVGTEIDDTVVTTKVKSALLADADIKSFDLKVETRKGAVQLSCCTRQYRRVPGM